jgi:hypothetical protein
MPNISNANSIGVSLLANDDKDVLPVQLESAKRLQNYLAQKYGFTPDRAFGHGDVSSGKQRTEGMTVRNFVRGTEAKPFRQGTMGVTGQLFKDFGGESYANISGTKAVLTPDQMNAMVKTGGAISVAELAQSLNNNMSTLITLTREKISINRAQLSETSRLSGDIFAAS